MANPLIPYEERRGNERCAWTSPYRLARAVKRDVFRRYHDFSRLRRREKWLRCHQEAGANIHPSLEFTGREDAIRHVHIAPAVIIERDVTFWLSDDSGADSQIHISARAFIGRSSYIGAFQPVSIGQSSLVGAHCYIISGNHCFQSRETPIRDQGYLGSPVKIADDVWIGTHVVILPGVCIARGAIIGAGSVVNRNVGEYEIWAGTPARFIKQRP